MYQIKWNQEIINTVDSREAAETLRDSYQSLVKGSLVYVERILGPGPGRVFKSLVLNVPTNVHSKKVVSLYDKINK